MASEKAHDIEIAMFHIRSASLAARKSHYQFLLSLLFIIQSVLVGFNLTLLNHASLNIRFHLNTVLLGLPLRGLCHPKHRQAGSSNLFTRCRQHTISPNYQLPNSITSSKHANNGHDQTVYIYDNNSADIRTARFHRVASHRLNPPVYLSPIHLTIIPLAALVFVTFLLATALLAPIADASNPLTATDLTPIPLFAALHPFNANPYPNNPPLRP
jgi:hypothetical protein